MSKKKHKKKSHDWSGWADGWWNNQYNTGRRYSRTKPDDVPDIARELFGGIYYLYATRKALINDRVDDTPASTDQQG